MDSIKSRGRHYISAILLVLVGVWFDQFTKTLAVDHLKGQDPFILFKNVFQFEYLENHGAAFGILQNKQIFFFIIVLIISVFIIWFYLHVPMTKKLLPLRICAVFIFSGAIGNFIDRLKLGYVVDFFYFKLIDFPVFNVADIYVTVGTFILAFLLLFIIRRKTLTEYFTVENEEGDRIDRYLAEEMPERSRSYLQKLIKEQYIKVNNKPVKAN